MKVRVLLDLDGVIANFYQGFANYLNENYGCTLDPSIEPKKYPFEDWGHGVDKIDFDAASFNWIKQNGFEKLPAFQGAKAFVNTLMKKYNVYIVTARIGDWEQKFPPEIKNKIKKNTFMWLKRLGIPVTKLYFAHDKVPFCKENGISIMVEDKLETALNASKEGIHTILMNRGYNGSKIDRLRIYRVYDFDEALQQLERLTGDKT